MAVCVTDFVQGTLMLIGLLIVPLVAYLTLSGSLSDLLTQSGAPGGAAAFLNPLRTESAHIHLLKSFPSLHGDLDTAVCLISLPASWL